jgi:hypothetical protein
MKEDGTWDRFAMQAKQSIKPSAGKQRDVTLLNQNRRSLSNSQKLAI